MSVTRSSLPISLAATGDLVVATPGIIVKVLQYNIVSPGAVAVTFRSGTTPLTGAMPLGANIGVPSIGPPPDGVLFQTVAGQALNLLLSAGVQVSGHMVIEKESVSQNA